MVCPTQAHALEWSSMKRRFTMAIFAVCLLPAQPTPVFRTESSLALVRFHVVHKNRYVTGLKPEDVVLLEDGAPREFTVFENAMAATRTVPVEMTLLFDTSGSVVDEGLLDPLAFKETLLDNLDGVRIAVYGFDRNMKRYSGPTRDYAQLQKAFAALGTRGGKGEPIELRLPPKRKADPNSGTWLFEAVAAVSRQAAGTPGDATRMVLAFSDGFPSTDSRPEDAADIDRELGIPVYPVVLGHQRLMQRMEEERRRLMPGESTSGTLSYLMAKQNQIADFARLGELTGGRSFDPPAITLTVTRSVLSSMVALVRTEYVVGFAPEISDAPRRRKLEIRLREKDAGKVMGGTRTVVH
jgi:VWFA-related protein